jgi:hypothetical protein
MKKLMTALVIASLSSAALAKPVHVSPQAAAAQASVPPLNSQGDYMRVADPTLVVVDGNIIGRDPSPDIRANLRRDQVALAAQ